MIWSWILWLDDKRLKWETLVFVCESSLSPHSLQHSVMSASETLTSPLSSVTGRQSVLPPGFLLCFSMPVQVPLCGTLISSSYFPSSNCSVNSRCFYSKIQSLSSAWETSHMWLTVQFLVPLVSHAVSCSIWNFPLYGSLLATSKTFSLLRAKCKCHCLGVWKPSSDNSAPGKVSPITTPGFTVTFCYFIGLLPLVGPCTVTQTGHSIDTVPSVTASQSGR